MKRYRIVVRLRRLERDEVELEIQAESKEEAHQQAYIITEGEDYDEWDDAFILQNRTKEIEG